MNGLQEYQEDQVTIAYDTMWRVLMQLAHKIGKEISKISPTQRLRSLMLPGMIKTTS